MRPFFHLSRSPITIRPILHVFLSGQVARENRPVWACVGRSPVKIDQCECVSRLPKIIRSFYFLLFSLQAYYAKALLRKHCKEGATVITQFWVTPKFCFPFLKKNLHGAVLNGTVQLLLPCKYRDRGEWDFWKLFQLTSPSLSPHLPNYLHNPYPH